MAKGEDTGAKEHNSQLRVHLASFGVLDKISSDSIPKKTSGKFKEFIRMCGIHHRVS